jgi:hypothetical protein
MVENRNINEKVQVGESRLKQGLSYKVPERSRRERGAAPLRILLPRRLRRGSQRVRL